MRVADLAVIGILAGAAAVGTLFVLARSEVASTDWEALPAEEAYGRLCASCHGPDGSAPTGAANTYKGKRQYWDVERLVEYMGDPPKYAKTRTAGRLGQRYMQPVPGHVPEATRRRVARYVYETLMD